MLATINGNTRLLYTHEGKSAEPCEFREKQKKIGGVGNKKIFWSSYTAPRVILYDIL